MKDMPATHHQAAESCSTGTAAPEPTSSTARIGVADLFRAHAAFVASFLKRLGVPVSETDDLVQEVFLVAHRKGGYVPGPAQPRSWLGAIAVRLARSRHRSAGRNRESADLSALDRMAATTADPMVGYEVQESLHRVQQALNTLDLEHRAVFVLYEIEGEACQAIAASLEVPLGTVYSRLHYARQRFEKSHTALLAQAPTPSTSPLPATPTRWNKGR